MADLEAVLADVSYLMAMEKSRSQPAARASKKIILPDPRYFIISLFFHLLFFQCTEYYAKIFGKNGRNQI